MTQRYFVRENGTQVGTYDGPDKYFPDHLIGMVEVPAWPADGKPWVWTIPDGPWVPGPPSFKPIDPAPFWLAAWQLLGLKKDDVLNAITDPDARYEASLDIDSRKRYLRDDPLTIQLSTLLGYPPEQMDSLWLYVQENYV